MMELLFRCKESGSFEGFFSVNWWHANRKIGRLYGMTNDNFDMGVELRHATMLEF